MKQQSLILILTIIVINNTDAQINESDTVKFQFKASATVNHQSGNVNILTIRNRVDFSYRPFTDVVLKSQNSSLYQEFSSKKADNDIFSRNYLYYKPQNKMYPFAIAYISTNYRRKINTRFFAGAGATCRLLDKTNHTLKISASAVYEHNHFNGKEYNYPVYNNSNTINIWRGTFFLSGWHWLFQKHVRMYYDAFWQPAFNNRKNFRTQYDIGADFPVWKGLGFTTLYTFTHENVVINNVRQEDRILTFGLMYNLKIK